ncbi:MAG: PspA/IM30 family protein [Myxococcales bacterium]|nr:PspA/IM30 family protein [Myxococcales bacterium]MCB9576853.1 PspA/IM30 family protein [Polyangiaceae bacterium]
MGIFDRMGRVISSNFNSLLDKAEDPKKSIELTLDEMRAQLKAARQEVVRSVAAEKQLRKKVEELDTEVEKWSKRAELAVKHDDDDLAREALLQKRRLTEERDRAEALRGEQRSAALEMKAELERMEAKLEELQAKKSTIITKAKQAKAGGGTEALGASGAGPTAFQEFRRMEDQIEGVETAVQAQREVEEALGGGRGPGGMSRDEVEAKFRSLEYGDSKGEPAGKGGSEIDDELAALKKKVRIGS